MKKRPSGSPPRFLREAGPEGARQIRRACCASIDREGTVRTKAVLRSRVFGGGSYDGYVSVCFPRGARSAGMLPTGRCCGFSSLCGDAHSSCPGFCLTQRILRDCGILATINLTWIANSVVWLLARMRSVSSIIPERPRHTLCRAFKFSWRTRLCLEKPSEIWCALVRQRNTCTVCCCCWRANDNADVLE